MKYLFLVFLSLSSVALIAQPGADTSSVDYSTGREYEIGEIRVEGAEGINKEVIVARGGIRPGDVINIPGEEISKAIQNLWSTGLFADVEVLLERTYGNTAFLLYRLQERPRLTKYEIVGVPKADREDIREQLNLRAGDPLTEYDRSQIRYVIDNFYTDKGYLNNSVQLVELNDTAAANGIILSVRVDRGEKVKIADIQFENNEVVDDRKLRSLMRNTKVRTQVDLSPGSLLEAKNEEEQMSFFEILGNLSFENVRDYLSERVALRIFNSSKFIESDFEADQRAIIAYYNSLGYRDAHIAYDTVYLADEDDLVVRMGIDEGSKYYFRNIRWEGNTQYSTEILSAILDIEKGDIYNQEKLNRKLFFDMTERDVSSLYMDDGYLFFSVTPKEVRVENDSIDLVIQIYEGQQATIDQVIIKGNDKTNERVIRRELRTMPGNKFSRADLIRSQREIAALGYFDPEQIGIVPIPNAEEGTVDIEYTVVEKPSDQIELSAGFGGAFGLYGSAGISLNNFSLRNLMKLKFDPIPAGDGQQLSFRLQTQGKNLQSYTFSFTEPWLGGKKPNSLSTSFNYTLLRYPRPEGEDQLIISRGGTVSLGKRLKWPDDYFIGYASLNFQNYYLENYTDFLVTDGSANNFNLKLTIARNSTAPNPLFPTSGSNVSFSGQFTPPYSALGHDVTGLPADKKYKWIEYHKWRFKADWFTTVAGPDKEQNAKNLVLKLGANFGFLGYYNKELGVSPFERFRLGGDGLSGGFTIYGYDLISLRGTDAPFFPVGTPQGAIVNNIDAFKNAPIFNKFNVELRYPLSLSQASTIYALAFLEGGNAYANFEHYNPFNLRKSTGIGLRLFLPMFGLLGFDYGIELDKSLAGQSFGDIIGRGAFHFKLGFEPE